MELMVTYEKFCEELIRQGFDSSIVNKLIEEYRIVKKEHLLGDEEKAILHSAKVSDLTLALIKQKVLSRVENVNEIQFRNLFNELIHCPKRTPEETILTLAIPRVAQSIVTIRSKTDVAHVKTIDPQAVDAYYCVCACDWMISQIVILFFSSEPNEASELIKSMLTKKVPLVEEFEDGTIVILKKDLPIKNEILIALYNAYPKRITLEELKNLTKSNIYTQVHRLEKSKLIHKIKTGCKLTRLGLKYVEDEIFSENIK